jgi:hypothetical protein
MPTTSSATSPLLTAAAAPVLRTTQWSWLSEVVNDSCGTLDVGDENPCTSGGSTVSGGSFGGDRPVSVTASYLSTIRGGTGSSSSSVGDDADVADLDALWKGHGVVGGSSSESGSPLASSGSSFLLPSQLLM